MTTPLWCLVAPGRAAVGVSGVLEHAAASLLATLVVTAAAWLPARLVPSLGPHLVPPLDAWDRF